MGDWSDKSPLWTPELKEQLQVRDDDDGMFFISYDDYLRYYRSTTICKVNDGYFQTSVRISQAKDLY